MSTSTSKYATSNSGSPTAWTISNFTVLQSDDTNYATLTSTTKNESDLNYLADFDFSAIPDDANLLSITVDSIIRISAAITGRTFGVQAAHSGTTLIGTEATISGTSLTIDTDHAVQQSITSSLPTVAQLKATGTGGFRIRTRCVTGNSATSRTWSLDLIKVTVVYGAPQALAGGSTSLSSGTGEITGTATAQALVGAATSVSSASAALSGTATPQALVGASSSLSSGSGVAKVAQKLIGASQSLSSTTGLLGLVITLAGSATSLSSTDVEELEVEEGLDIVEIDGTALSLSSGTGAAKNAIAAIGASSSLSSGTGALGRAIPLAGTALSLSSGTGDISGTATAQALAGASESLSSGSATLRRAIPLAGSSTSVSSGTADISGTATSQALAGASTSLSSATGAGRVAQALIGAAQGLSSASGTLIRAIPLAGASTSLSSGTGEISGTATSQELVGDAVSLSGSDATLTVTGAGAAVELVGESSSLSSAAGTATNAIAAEGDSTSLSSATGNLANSAKGVGSALSLSSATGALDRTLGPLSGAAQSVSSASASATLDIQASGDASSLTSSAAGLTVIKSRPTVAIPRPEGKSVTHPVRGVPTVRREGNVSLAKTVTVTNDYTQWADGSVRNATYDGYWGPIYGDRWDPVIYDGFGIATSSKIHCPMWLGFMTTEDAGVTWTKSDTIIEYGGVNWHTTPTIQMMNELEGYWATAYEYTDGYWGFLRTTDGWQTAERFPIAVEGTTYYPLGIKAFDDGVIWMWATTDLRQRRIAQMQRVLRSTDGGETWELKFNATPYGSPDVYDGGFDASSADVALVNVVDYFDSGDYWRMCSRFFRTDDGGETWDMVVESPDPLLDDGMYGNWSQVACYGDTMMVFPWSTWTDPILGTWIPLAISTDGGLTWGETTCPCGISATPIYCAYAKDGRFFFGDDYGAPRLWMTEDDGMNWNVLTYNFDEGETFTNLGVGYGTVCAGDSGYVAVYPGSQGQNIETSIIRTDASHPPVRRVDTVKKRR